MMKLFLGLAGVSGFLSVALGAFGAHALKTKLSTEMMAVYQTGIQYQQFHALALLGVALLMSNHPSPSLTNAGWFFTAGTVIFSGSLYALALTEIKILGAVTPLGGLAFLAGWACLIRAALQQTTSS
jgi:uncharacterized membrane protein YgdD (TMEM256/DUF423 family)